jgi:hypothetical protein
VIEHRRRRPQFGRFVPVVLARPIRPGQMQGNERPQIPEHAGTELAAHQS